ncbi:hypothetical protein F5Y08DRAFT_23558 [Xylaria arbuscula]|nr:hypothetical protein F5Y08DRAFT_23558 [Xylaria arbuscula]
MSNADSTSEGEEERTPPIPVTPMPWNYGPDSASWSSRSAPDNHSTHSPGMDQSVPTGSNVNMLSLPDLGNAFLNNNHMTTHSPVLEQGMGTALEFTLSLNLESSTPINSNTYNSLPYHHQYPSLSNPAASPGGFGFGTTANTPQPLTDVVRPQSVARSVPISSTAIPTLAQLYRGLPPEGFDSNGYLKFPNFQLRTVLWLQGRLKERITYGKNFPERQDTGEVDWLKRLLNLAIRLMNFQKYRKTRYREAGFPLTDDRMSLLLREQLKIWKQFEDRRRLERLRRDGEDQRTAVQPLMAFYSQPGEQQLGMYNAPAVTTPFTAPATTPSTASSALVALNNYARYLQAYEEAQDNQTPSPAHYNQGGEGSSRGFGF